MKKIVKFSLTLLAAGIISACSSSNDGENPAAPTTANSSANQGSSSTASSGNPASNAGTTNNTQAPSTNNQTTNNPTTQPTTTNSPNAMGSAFRTRDSKEFDIAKASTYKQHLIVDGKNFPVAWGGIISGGFTSLKNSTINGVTYKDFTVSGAKYANTKFGHIDGYVFAQGDVTPVANIPTTGIVSYKVDGVFVANGETSTSNNHTLNVDFANKTVNGDVAPNVTITNAKIEGNEFDGKAVHNGKSAELEGRFYGSDASEIGGAYSSSNFSGAFGGKKQ